MEEIKVPTAEEMARHLENARIMRAKAIRDAFRAAIAFVAHLPQQIGALGRTA